MRHYLNRESIGHVGIWAVVVAAMLTALGYWSYTPDDGFIHLTFTRNLVATGTFAFSSGIPVNGSTSISTAVPDMHVNTGEHKIIPAVFQADRSKQGNQVCQGTVTPPYTPIPSGDVICTTGE